MRVDGGSGRVTTVSIRKLNVCNFVSFPFISAKGNNRNIIQYEQAVYSAKKQNESVESWIFKLISAATAINPNSKVDLKRFVTTLDASLIAILKKNDFKRSILIWKNGQGESLNICFVMIKS